MPEISCEGEKNLSEKNIELYYCEQTHINAPFKKHLKALQDLHYLKKLLPIRPQFVCLLKSILQPSYKQNNVTATSS